MSKHGWIKQLAGKAGAALPICVSVCVSACLCDCVSVRLCVKAWSMKHVKAWVDQAAGWQGGGSSPLLCVELLASRQPPAYKALYNSS